ncbi:(d)CMP kinase [Alkaliphilus crotonatoxidans]
MKAVQIAIDGPAGAGKSTIAKKIANTLGFTYIDTGAMYRALTLEVLNKGIPIDEISEIIKIAQTTEILFIEGNIILNGINVNEAVREARVNQYVSHVAQIPEVREQLVAMQRKIAAQDNVVMDGRDIGTYVLPEATLKIFLTASVHERALRRYMELKRKNAEVALDEIKNQIINRDKMDSERTASPLVKASDAIEIDTTGLTIDKVCQLIIDHLEQQK